MLPDGILRPSLLQFPIVKYGPPPDFSPPPVYTPTPMPVPKYGMPNPIVECIPCLAIPIAIILALAILALCAFIGLRYFLKKK